MSELRTLYVADAAPAPVCISAPRVTIVAPDTSPRPGATLSASLGEWSGEPSAYARQWYRDVDAIPSETAETYVLTTDDAYAAVTCEIAATNDDGTTRVWALPRFVSAILDYSASASPTMTNTSASGGTAVDDDASATVTTFAANAVRRIAGRGVYRAEAFTQAVPSPAWQGFVAGTSGTGVLGTGLSMGLGTWTLHAVATEAGVPTVDVEITGLPSSGENNLMALAAGASVLVIPASAPRNVYFGMRLNVTSSANVTNYVISIDYYTNELGSGTRASRPRDEINIAAADFAARPRFSQIFEPPANARSANLAINCVTSGGAGSIRQKIGAPVFGITKRAAGSLVLAEQFAPMLTGGAQARDALQEVIEDGSLNDTIVIDVEGTEYTLTRQALLDSAAASRTVVPLGEEDLASVGTVPSTGLPPGFLVSLEVTPA